MISHSTHTLANGLRVIHSGDDATQMVTVNLMYDVGARDEQPGLTGIAHLFEHLMFGGSAHVPDFDSVLERAGGISNAWTSNDFTNFYEVLPAANLDTALYLESDRMLALSFSPKALEVQRNVVIEEFKQQCLNRPYGDMWHHLRRLVYTRHPYRYPVIGKEISHIRQVTDADVRQWFYGHYAPRRAVLAITGNVSADRAFGAAERWFGDIPDRHTPDRDTEAEPPQTGSRSLTVSGPVPMTAVTRAYRMGGYGSPDYIPADLLTDILSNGRSSRFYRRLLLGTDLFSSADASIMGSEEPGVLLITARLKPGADDSCIARAGEAIDSVIDDLLTTDPPTPHELQRAVNRFVSVNSFAALSIRDRAMMLAESVLHGEDINSIVPRYRAVTTGDIRDAARRILSPDSCSTLIYKPKDIG